MKMPSEMMQKDRPRTVREVLLLMREWFAGGSSRWGKGAFFYTKDRIARTSIDIFTPDCDIDKCCIVGAAKLFTGYSLLYVNTIHILSRNIEKNDEEGEMSSDDTVNVNRDQDILTSWNDKRETEFADIVDLIDRTLSTIPK